jgi:hypothetical protein
MHNILISITRPAAAYGRGAFSPVQWMNSICGPQYIMWSAIPCVQESSIELKTIHGAAHPLTAGCAMIHCFPPFLNPTGYSLPTGRIGWRMQKMKAC